MLIVTCCLRPVSPLAMCLNQRSLSEAYSCEGDKMIPFIAGFVLFRMLILFFMSQVTFHSRLDVKETLNSILFVTFTAVVQ